MRNGNYKEMPDAPDKFGESEKEVLWVLTELYYPENNQTGYYMTGIAEGLSEKYAVKVICGQPNYAAKGVRAPKHEIHKNVEIFRVWSTTLDKNVLVYRLLNMITQGVSMFAASLIKIKSGQKVLVVSAPPSLPFVTALAAKLKNAGYNLIIQDKYPEILIAVGKARPDSLFIRVLNKCNVWLYSNAEKIIAVGRDMQQLISAQLDGTTKRTPIEVIANWASLEEVEPLPREENSILKEHDLSNKFVFLYAGNMGYPQDIESIIQCAGKMKEDARIHFLFIGSGVKRKWLEKEIKDNRLKNVTILDPRPREEQNEFLNACDVGLVPLVEKMFGVAMPSRTYNILAAGKPVLALTEEGTELAKIIDEDAVGWYVPPRQPEQLLEMIYRIYENHAVIAKMGVNARRAASEKHSEKVAVNKYLEKI